MSVEAFAHQKNKGAAKAIEGFKKRKEAQRLHTSKELRSYQRLMKREGYVPGSGASRRRHDTQGGGGEEEEDDDDDDDDDDGIDVVEDQQAQRAVDSTGHKESGRGDRDHGRRAPNNERSAASKDEQDELFRPGDDDEDRVRPGHGDDDAAAAARKRPPARDDGVVARGAANAASSSSSHPKKDRLPHKVSKRHSPHKSSLQRAADRRLEQIQQEQERRTQQEKIRAQKLRERKQRTKMLGERTKKGQPIMKNIVHDILRKLEREKEQEQQQQEAKK
jgi:rRNA processing